MKTISKWMLAICVIAISGCSAVVFEDVHYAIPVDRQDAGVVAVVDKETLDREVGVWVSLSKMDAKPGTMLKQVADIEFPQMFKYYQASQVYAEPRQGARRLTIVMGIESYDMDDAKAHIKVRVAAYKPGKQVAFENSYSAIGDSSALGSFWTGGFTKKAAVRRSSLDAFKKIFTLMRLDIQDALR